MEVIQLNNEYRVQLDNGNLLPGRFHRPEQADEHRLRHVANNVLNVLYPGRNSNMPGRASARMLQSQNYYADNERRIQS